MKKAEQLIQTIIKNPDSTDDGVLANELLREFHRGFPVEHLRPLLLSNNAKIVGTASFIADELGSLASPLLDQVTELLHFPDKFVRADAIGTILTCTAAKHQYEIASVISILADCEWPLRWKTMEFMSLASLEQLRGGLQYFEARVPDSDHVRGLRWLTGDRGGTPDEILSWLRSNNPVDRKYGVIAAARRATTTQKLLVVASAIEDEDVKRFADSMLKMRRGSMEEAW